MLTEDEAYRRILAAVSPLETEIVPLLDALGRFVATAHTATHALPAFDNSAMDGYALAVDERAGTLPAGTTLQVRGEQPAGPDRGLSVEPGGAVRIFTGGPVPAGAVAVVMQEDVDRTGDRIVLKEPVAAGEFIRRAGGDLARGQRILEPGDRLTPGRLGLLASQGLAAVAVRRRPRVAVLATGDELRAPGQALGPGEIYESNGVLLATLAATLGAQVMILPRARDDRAELDTRLAEGLAGHDALVVAGGVSVGERDFVKERLAAAGVAPDLWRVRIKPGKPFLYGRAAGDGGAHVFGLPGNPVSAFVTFLLFVRPALLRMAGAREDALALPAFPATAAVELTNHGDRPHYLRGTLDARGVFAPGGQQESHALFALSRSRALVRVEAETVIPAGASLEALVWEAGGS